MFRIRSMTLTLLALVCCLPGTLAFAQAYTSIVIFGDSLTDTGNDATVSYNKYGSNAQVPAPVTGYTLGRFTDGTDTVPAAKAYYGVWIEQLAAKLAAKPTINYSLNTVTPGGTNYAYGFATTGTGQSTFTYPPPNTALNFQVNNIGAQLSSYLGTNPTITSSTLFVVWGGANDLIAASTSANPQAAIQAAAQNEASIVQTLITAGATDFIVPNLPPLGLVPRFNGSTATSVPATQLAAGFDQYLAAYLAALPTTYNGKTIHLYQLDTYTLFNTIVANPSARGFANVTASSSAAYTGVTTTNPDTYLFWDDLHPTTYGHYQLATAALTLLGTPITTTTTLATTNSQPNPGQNFTLTATVAGAAGSTGTPQGTVTFLDGTTAIGMAYVTGSTTTGTATLTTSYPTSGKHTITAQFAGANGYSSSLVSASGAVALTVTPPILTPTLSPTSLTIVGGTYGLDTVTLTPMGGYSGTATVSCGTLPAHFTCTVATPTVTLPGTNAVVTDNVTIGTIASASLARPQDPRTHGNQELLLVCGLLPGFGLLSFAAVRRKRTALGRIVLPGLFVLLAGGASLGLSGCTNATPTYPSPIAPAGTYTVPISVVSNGTTTTLSLTVVVQ